MHDDNILNAIPTGRNWEYRGMIDEITEKLKK
jgi:hypothetical protein